MTPKQIKDIRKKRGWSQKRLAEKVNVTERTVQYWEAGTRNPSGPAVLWLTMLKNEKS